MYESWASWFCWYTANGMNSCIVMGATYTYLYSTAIPNCECKCDQSYVLYNLNCYQFSLLSLSQSCSHFALQCNSMWLHHVSVCCVLQICIFQSKIWRFISKMCLVFFLALFVFVFVFCSRPEAFGFSMDLTSVYFISYSINTVYFPEKYHGCLS